MSGILNPTKFVIEPENFEALNTAGLVSLDMEVEHVENYLYIEKLRFGERLNIVWNLAEKNIWIPAMTLQPLVENAVRNGICQQTNGGTIWISSQKKDNQYIIEIKDNATRAGIKEISDDNMILNNVKLRVEELNGGTVTWEQTDEVGMYVHIIIPI